VSHEVSSLNAARYYKPQDTNSWPCFKVEQVMAALV